MSRPQPIKLEHDEMDKYGQVEVYPYVKALNPFARWTIRTKAIDKDTGMFVDDLTVDFGKGEMTVQQARAFTMKINALCDLAEEYRK